MRIALYLLTTAAVLLAWIVVRRVPHHRPIALALSVGLAAEIGRAALLAWVLPIPVPKEPLEGCLRLAVYADRLLVLVWPFALAGAAVRVLARRPAWPMGIGYIVAAAALIVGYPALRFDALRRALLAIELAALLVGVGALMTWFRRAVRVDERGDVSIRTAAVLVLGHGAMVITTYAAGLFGEAWKVGQSAYLAVLAMLAEHVSRAAAAGDLDAARIAHEAMGRLLAAPGALEGASRPSSAQAAAPSKPDHRAAIQSELRGAAGPEAYTCAR
jgi:hypothetical protein